MTAQYMPDGLDPAGAVYQAYEAAGFIPAPGSNGHANVIIEETLTWESLTRPCYNNRADEATALPAAYAPRPRPRAGKAGTHGQRQRLQAGAKNGRVRRQRLRDAQRIRRRVTAPRRRPVAGG